MSKKAHKNIYKIIAESNEISKSLNEIKIKSIKLWSYIQSVTGQEENLSNKTTLRELQNYIHSKLIDTLRDSKAHIQYIKETADKLCNI